MALLMRRHFILKLTREPEPLRSPSPSQCHVSGVASPNAFPCGLIASVPILLQSLINDVFQLGWQIGFSLTVRLGHGFQDSVKLSRGFTAERQCSCSHFIALRQKRQVVRASRSLLALVLETCKAPCPASSRTSEIGRLSTCAPIWLPKWNRCLCQSKVQNLGTAFFGDEDIRGA